MRPWKASAPSRCSGLAGGHGHHGGGARLRAHPGGAGFRAHPGQGRWPPTLKMGPVFIAIGMLFAGGVYTGLATRGRALGRVALRELGAAGLWRRRIEKAVVEARPLRHPGGRGAAVLFALVVSQYLVPTLSKHTSFKPLLESYSRFASTANASAATRSRRRARASTATRRWSSCPPRSAWPNSCAVATGCSRWCRPPNWPRSTWR
jgi:hypothetical protein